MSLFLLRLPFIFLLDVKFFFKALIIMIGLSATWLLVVVSLSTMWMLVVVGTSTMWLFIGVGLSTSLVVVGLSATCALSKNTVKRVLPSPLLYIGAWPFLSPRTRRAKTRDLTTSAVSLVFTETQLTYSFHQSRVSTTHGSSGFFSNIATMVL